MLRIKNVFLCYKHLKVNIRNFSQIEVPIGAEAVIIGGGSQGCHTLYHLTKRGVKAILLERARLTAGTTWHTAGLVWRLRPNDVDIQLLDSSRRILTNLENETGLDPGWIQNGGIFIAHSETRLDEYRRLSSIGNSFGIENYILTPDETCKVFPLLDKESFMGGLYSPGDGVVDPAMLSTALTRASFKNGGKVIENCPVTEILVEDASYSRRKIYGVKTPYGTIKTDVVINATGVWGNDLMGKHNITLPLIAMKHAYIVSEPILGVRGLPNIRDHDFSLYFRIQGESICMGGYESDPIFIKNVPENFNFSLYELDWSIFERHIKGATQICPIFGRCGIKSTVCGPESFTPDHKPLMGPDPNIMGLFHNCGYNSAGMMFGGGCGEQLALWVTKGQPDLYMFQFDIRRFTPEQNRNKKWIKERSHESYAKNYSMIFSHDQPLAGRNFKTDPLHDDMIKYGAFMEEKQGWERPGFFIHNEITPIVQPYDWYGSYSYQKNKDNQYIEKLNGDLRYTFSKHHDLIGNEVLACRNNAVVFNMSYFCKMYLCGPDAQQIANYIFTADTNIEDHKVIYSCILNTKGGVEADVTVSKILSGTGEPHNPHFEGGGYYIVAGGASGNYTYSYLKAIIESKNLKAHIKDITNDLGVISIQGPKSRFILQQITDYDLSNENLQWNSHKLINVKAAAGKMFNVRLLRVSFVGELGYELHVPKQNASAVYSSLMDIGKSENLINAGYRALYSLSSEKGYHLWGFDLRTDDTPIEANLEFVCRNTSEYNGKPILIEQKLNGITKKLVYFTLEDQIPIWGLEGVYRNGKACAHIRRGEYAYTLGKSFGQAYVERRDGEKINNEYIMSGKYQIDIMGKLYNAQCHLKSPFDPKNKRILGIYD